MENNNQNNNKFINGFLLGALIGAGVVFLFGTKKGKRLLKTISEEGLGNFSKILDEANVSEEINENKEIKEILPEKDIAVEQTSTFEEERPRARRFFKGIARRLN